VDGTSIEVPSADGIHPTLVLVFSPDCGSCKRNWPAWKQVIAAAREKARVVAVNIAGQVTTEYIKSHDMADVAVLTTPTYATRAAYNLRRTPTTMLLSPTGQLKQIWIGVLSEADRTTLMSQLQ
jgi:hypothetical protein